MTIREAKRLARAALTQKDAAFFYAGGVIRAERSGDSRFIPSPTPDLDINCILCSILNVDKTYLLTHSQNELTKTQLENLASAVSKRRTGLPIAYITCVKEFYGRDFCVSPAVLCDMCTGSGCVGLSVFLAVKENPQTDLCKIESVCLADISEAALEIAKLNAKRLLHDEDKARFSFIKTNLFAGITDTFDLICTNPPYIPHDEAAALLEDGRNEPLLALDGDAHADGTVSESGGGLAVIRRLVPAAFKRLNGGGTLLMECGEYNAQKAADLCRAAGFNSVQVHTDFAGQLRLVEAQKA